MTIAGGGEGANEAKVDQTTEMYFLLSGQLIQEGSNTRGIVTAKYKGRTEIFTTIASRNMIG